MLEMGTLWCNWQHVLVETIGNYKENGKKNPIQVLALSKAMSQMVLPRAEGDQSLDTDPATKGKQSYRGERSGIQVLI